MSELDNLERLQREEARWRILRALDIARPDPLTETTLFRMLHDIELPISPAQVRKEAAYLQDRKLVSIRDREAATWLVSLTHHGVDIVEYTVPCLPGIARPPR